MIQRTIINHRLNDTKKWISELEDRVMEITGTEQEKKKKEDSLRDCQDIIKL